MSGIEDRNAGIRNIAGGGVNLSISGNTDGTPALLTSGTAILVGGDNVTLSQNGQSITISAAAGGGAGGSFSAGISTGGNTLGTSGTVSGRVVFVGGNNITLSQSLNAGSVTITVSAFNQTAQASVFSGGFSTNGNTAGDTGLVTGRLNLIGGNNITLSGSTNAGSISVTISAFNQTAQASVFTGGFSTGGNTAGDTGLVTGRICLAGGNNITLSGSTNAGSITVSIAGGAGGAAGSNTLGMSNIGNTSGTTGVVSDTAIRFLFAGGNNITLSQSLNGQSGTITISAFNQTAQASVFSGGFSTNGNTSGDTGLVTGRLNLIGGNNITLSGSTNAGSISVSISAAASALVPTISHYNNFPYAGETATANPLGGIGSSDGTLWVFPLHDPQDIFPGNMTANSILLDMVGSGSTNTSGAHTYTVSIGFYTLQDASNLALVHSGSTSWALAAATANGTNSYHGNRWLSIHSSKFNVAPTFSNTSYWCGLWMRSSSVAYSLSFNGVRWMLSDNRSGYMAALSASNKSVPWYPFHGIYSVSFATAMPASINRTDMSYGGSGMGQAVPHIVLNNLGGIYG